jgi:arylsulfatase A-like enzyme
MWLSRWTALGLLAGGCGSPGDDSALDTTDLQAPTTEASDTEITPSRPNIVVVVFDDFGNDVFGPSGYASGPAEMPNLESLVADGTYFTSAYSYPSCSPTRSAIVTGKFGRRTGIGRTITPDQNFELALSEVTIAEAGALAGYQWHAVGKWHLASPFSPSGIRHPLKQGFVTYQGVFANLANYLNYFKVHEDGIVSLVEGRYLTTDEVDDAVRVVTTAREPFGLYLTFHAPHSPFHMPPTSLQGTTSLPADPDSTLYRAMLEAADTELGRLLEVLPENTVVFALGDNGTPFDAVLPPFDPALAKNTVGELGVNVPLVVWGPGIAVGGRSSALLHVVDLYATIAALMGADASAALDSRSFADLLVDPTAPGPRTEVVVEEFAPNGSGPYVRDVRAIRDVRYKYVRDAEFGELLFDVGEQPQEGANLLDAPLDADAQVALDRLRGQLDVWEATVVPAP